MFDPGVLYIILLNVILRANLAEEESYLLKSNALLIGLLYCYCIFAVVWVSVFCVSSSWCHGLVSDL